MKLGLIILAGGQSSRMGRDKSSLPWHGRELLTDLLCRSAAFPFSERLLASNRPYDLKKLPVLLRQTFRIVSDNFPGCGPLGGFEASFRQGHSDYYLVLSVDLPFYDFSPLPRLLGRVKEMPDCTAVIPQTPRQQPLAALYNAKLYPAICERLQQKQYRLRGLYENQTAVYLDETSATVLYTNINTPADYQRALGRDLNQQRRRPMLTLCGPHSGAGKTTAAIFLSRRFTALGYRVAYVKSTHHTQLRPKAGSDTERVKKAGALSAVLCGPGQLQPGQSKKEALLALAQAQDADLVLVESRAHGPAPTLDVTAFTDREALWQEACFLMALSP